MARSTVSAAPTLSSRSSGSKPGRRIVGRAWPPAERVAHQLADIDRPHRLDEGEGRDGGQLEPAPGALCARGVARGGSVGIPAPARRCTPGFSSTGRRSSPRPRRSLVLAARRRSRRSRGLDARIDRLQRPAEDLRAHVDAERGLQRRALSRRARAARRTCSAGRAARRARRPPAGSRRAILASARPAWHGSRDIGPAFGDRRLALRSNSASSQSSRMARSRCRRVRAARQFGAPQLVARVLRPAAERSSAAGGNRVQRRGRRGPASTEARAIAASAASSGASATWAAKPLSPAISGVRSWVATARQAARRRLPRARPRAPGPRRNSRGPGADPLGDQAGPVGAGRLGRQIGHGRQRARGRGAGPRRLQRGDVAGP
jgi:hypothetical protein